MLLLFYEKFVDLRKPKTGYAARIFIGRTVEKIAFICIRDMRE